ncbi:hypothetical protein H4R19_006928, partial [Coemansia spiralis]
AGAKRSSTSSLFAPVNNTRASIAEARRNDGGGADRTIGAGPQYGSHSALGPPATWLAEAGHIHAPATTRSSPAAAGHAHCPAAAPADNCPIRGADAAAGCARGGGAAAAAASSTVGVDPGAGTGGRWPTAPVTDAGGLVDPARGAARGTAANGTCSGVGGGVERELLAGISWTGSQRPTASAGRGSAGARPQEASGSPARSRGPRALPQHGRLGVAHNPSSALAFPAPDFAALPSPAALAARQQQSASSGRSSASDALGGERATPPVRDAAGLHRHAQLARNPPTNPLPRLPSAMERPVSRGDTELPANTGLESRPPSVPSLDSSDLADDAFDSAF